MPFHLRNNGQVGGPYDEQTIIEWIRKRQISAAAEIGADGRSWAPLASHPPFAAELQMASTEIQGDSTGGLIPYKNPKALTAYYLGIFSGIPLIGFPLGIAAFVLGLQGLRARQENPVIKGSVHAGIGIGCGGIFALLWGAWIVYMVVMWIA